VTRQELQERLRPNGTFVEFDEGLNTAIKKLRQALLDSADSPIYIETLPRRGYRFIAPVTGAFVGPNENAGSISEEDAAGRNGAEASNRASEGAFGSKRGVLGRLSALRYIAFAAIVVANSSCTRAGIRAAISPRCALRTEMGRTTTCFSAWLGIRFMKRGPPGLRTTVWSRFRYISSAKNHVLSCMRFR